MLQLRAFLQGGQGAEEWLPWQIIFIARNFSAPLSLVSTYDSRLKEPESATRGGIQNRRSVLMGEKKSSHLFASFLGSAGADLALFDRRMGPIRK